MGDITGEFRVRVNSTFLPHYSGKPVVLLGRVKRVEPSGMNFIMESSDGKDVGVKLVEPVQDILEGLIEVHGIGQGGNVLCKTYNTFQPEDAENFDMATYNEAVSLIHTNPTSPWKLS
ncbi:replication protein A 14 kDa subunit-like [Oratosquilla oratoria]|uniref:replication protein A 14 kDa subunit-like n=1 Tax=Oratosquilla oratoria TaxID=337810 RepID=UPI003F75A90D